MKYRIAWMIDWRPSWPLLHDRTKTIKRLKDNVTSGNFVAHGFASLVELMARRAGDAVVVRESWIVKEAFAEPHLARICVDCRGDRRDWLVDKGHRYPT